MLTVTLPRWSVGGRERGRGDPSRSRSVRRWRRGVCGRNDGELLAAVAAGDVESRRTVAGDQLSQTRRTSSPPDVRDGRCSA